MKKKNIIIICIFILAIFAYYLYNDYSKQELIIEESASKKNINDDAMVSVYLTGEVNRTGEFIVPSDWNLEMLLDYVGLKENADVRGLDLTVLLQDSTIYNIPDESTGIYITKVNINTCTIEELKTIKGIGDVLAQKIISYRETAFFDSIEDIKNVSGIGDAMYEKIKNYITV